MQVIVGPCQNAVATQAGNSLHRPPTAVRCEVTAILNLRICAARPASEIPPPPPDVTPALRRQVTERQQQAAYVAPAGTAAAAQGGRT